MATSDGSKKRRGQRTRPVLQPLEERALLSTVPVASEPSIQLHRDAAWRSRSPSRSMAPVQPHGNLGRRSSGALDLVLSGTNEQTGVIAKVKGGSGVAMLQSIEYGGAFRPLRPDSLSGVGGTLIDVVNLKNFDLVSGGQDQPHGRRSYPVPQRRCPQFRDQPPRACPNRFRAAVRRLSAKTKVRSSSGTVFNIGSAPRIR